MTRTIEGKRYNTDMPTMVCDVSPNGLVATILGTRMRSSIGLKRAAGSSPGWAATNRPGAFRLGRIAVLDDYHRGHLAKMTKPSVTMIVTIAAMVTFSRSNCIRAMLSRRSAWPGGSNSL